MGTSGVILFIERMLDEGHGHSGRRTLKNVGTVIVASSTSTVPGLLEEREYMVVWVCHR